MSRISGRSALIPGDVVNLHELLIALRPSCQKFESVRCNLNQRTSLSSSLTILLSYPVTLPIPTHPFFSSHLGDNWKQLLGDGPANAFCNLTANERLWCCAFHPLSTTKSPVNHLCHTKKLTGV